MPQALDLAQPAANGLKRGYTTGTCAAAAAKAAALYLGTGQACGEVSVPLPDGEHYIVVPVADVSSLGENTATATVVKDAGDDPDVTHKARISAAVCKNGFGEIRWLRGAGIGEVTVPGLQVPVGEPAINPAPRRMIREALDEACAQAGWGRTGFDVRISCEGGEEIAKRTFNPRLGIEGGISIIGTSGVVEPKSRAAYLAAIEIYIRVALAENPESIVLTPGNLGQRFAVASLGLPLRRVVQMSNYAGFALGCLANALEESGRELPALWVAGHPGKLAKLIDGVADTHSSASEPALGVVRRVASEFGWPEQAVADIASTTTVEGAAAALRGHGQATEFWGEISRRIAIAVAKTQSRVGEIKVRLFAMDGAPLGEGRAA